MTTDGFFSAVEDREDNNFLLVRSRAREDSMALAAAVDGGEVVESPHADYRWRVRVHRTNWTKYVADQARAIDYDNFKNAVAGRQGVERARVYGDVWSVLLGLQR